MVIGNDHFTLEIENIDGKQWVYYEDKDKSIEPWYLEWSQIKPQAKIAISRLMSDVLFARQTLSS